MRRYSIKEILDKFKWHPDYDLSKVVVRYIDRPKGVSEIYGDEITDIGHKFIYTFRSAIPHHRIVEIIYDGKIVWKRGGDDKGEQTE
uniref:UPF0248 protein ENL48_02325 n=1 Tax=Geoglobus ahangari TaxID=113653 RepID=A0A7C3UCN3_9EURY